MPLPALLRRNAVPAGICVWLAGLGIGIHHLAAYSLQAGPVAEAPRNEWPAGLPVALEPGRYNLIVALHPECPCSRATLSELERVLAESAKAGPGIKVWAVFEAYSTLPEAVEDSDLWKSATALPGATALRDDDGAIAAAAGARTSGEVRLFSPQGVLLFSGGITGSRGHAGENPGSDAVIALATGQDATPHLGVPVFGCSLDR